MRCNLWYKVQKGTIFVYFNLKQKQLLQTIFAISGFHSEIKFWKESYFKKILQIDRFFYVINCALLQLCYWEDTCFEFHTYYLYVKDMGQKMPLFQASFFFFCPYLFQIQKGGNSKQVSNIVCLSILYWKATITMIRCFCCQYPLIIDYITPQPPPHQRHLRQKEVQLRPLHLFQQQQQLRPQMVLHQPPQLQRRPPWPRQPRLEVLSKILLFSSPLFPDNWHPWHPPFRWPRLMRNIGKSTNPWKCFTDLHAYSTQVKWKLQHYYLHT